MPNVKQGELVLISISGSDLFDSQMTLPNQTVCQSVGFNDMHSYRFNAEVSGNYLLRLNGWTGRNLTYTISSSHQIGGYGITISPTPFSISGSIDSQATVWENLFGVQQGGVVLLSIAGSDLLDSKIILPNQTVYLTAGFSPMLCYQFEAEVSGTYMIELNGWSGRPVNYTITASYPLTLPPTSPAQPTSPPPVEKENIDAGASYTLRVPDSFPDNGTTFAYDFGDNTIVVTDERFSVHVYGANDTFTATIRSQNDTSQAVIHTVIITVGAGGATSGGITPQLILQFIGVIIAGIGVFAGYWYYKHRERPAAKPALEDKKAGTSGKAG